MPRIQFEQQWTSSSVRAVGALPLQQQLLTHFLRFRLSDQADLTDSLEKSKLQHYRLTSEKVAMPRAGLRYSLFSEGLTTWWQLRQPIRVLHTWAAESTTIPGFLLAVGLRVRYCIKYIQNSVGYCMQHFCSCTCCSWKEWTIPWGYKASGMRSMQRCTQEIRVDSLLGCSKAKQVQHNKHCNWEGCHSEHSHDGKLRKAQYARPCGLKSI